MNQPVTKDDMKRTYEWLKSGKPDPRTDLYRLADFYGLSEKTIQRLAEWLEDRP